LVSAGLVRAEGAPAPLRYVGVPPASRLGPGSDVLWAKWLPFEAGGEPEAEREIEIRQLFELEEFGESPAVE
jgi:hypothetical protein